MLIVVALVSCTSVSWCPAFWRLVVKQSVIDGCHLWVDDCIYVVLFTLNLIVVLWTNDRPWFKYLHILRVALKKEGYNITLSYT